MSIKNLIELQTAAGVSTAKIHATMLLDDSGSLVIPKDISNAKRAARSELLATRTSNEAIFELLKQKIVSLQLRHRTGHWPSSLFDVGTSRHYLTSWIY
jgi:hypothetical protein